MAKLGEPCGAVMGDCTCSLAKHSREIPHTCESKECGGQWRTDPLEYVRYPSPGNLLKTIFGSLLGKDQDLQ